MEKGKKAGGDRPNRYDNARDRYRRPALLLDRDLQVLVADGHRRAVDALRQHKEFSTCMIKLPAEVQSDVIASVERIARSYWDRVEYDAREKNVEARDQILALSGTLEKLLKLLDKKTSSSTKQSISDQLTPRHERMRISHNRLSPIVAANEQLLAACKALTSQKGVRQGAEALVETSRLILNQWTQVTGLPLKHRRWQLVPGHEHAGNLTEELDAADAYFVQLMIQAFDPTVTASQVRSALTEIVKRENRKERARIPE